MSDMGKPTRVAETGLARRLGLGVTTLTGVGVILGAGIYVLVGVAAGEAGNAVWLSFLIAAAVAGLTGLSYARLARLRPRDAPEFQYVGMAFRPSLAFLAGWLILWAVVISSAAVALGFAGYLHHLLGTPILPGAIGLVLFSSLVVFLGIGESAILAGILTFIEVGGLVFIIGIGIPHFGSVNMLEMPLGMAGTIGAASLVFFAYLGFEGMANLSEEMKNPERDLPRAILLALGISTLLYMLVSLAAVSVLGWKTLSQSEAPLALVAVQALGSNAGMMLTLVALFSTANTVLLLLLAASRAMWAMSCAGVLPKVFCVIGEERRTPWLTIIVVGVFASLFTTIKNIGDVAEFTNFATLLAFAGVNASALKLFGWGSSGSGFKHVLLNIVMPALGLIASIFLAANAGWRAALFGGMLIAVGLLVYLVTGAILRRTLK
jgi:APA family basic amino acid/polyamine antiporter